MCSWGWQWKGWARKWSTPVCSTGFKQKSRPDVNKNPCIPSLKDIQRPVCCTESCSRSLTDGKATCWAGPCSQNAQKLTHHMWWLSAGSPSTRRFSAAPGRASLMASAPQRNIHQHWPLTLSCAQLPHVPFTASAGGSQSLLKKPLSPTLCVMVVSASPCTELPWSSTAISWGCHRDFSPLPVWCREPPGALTKLSLVQPSVKQRHSAGEWDMKSEMRICSQEFYHTLPFFLTLGYCSAGLYDLQI